MNNYEAQWREEVFNQLVKYDVKKYPTETDGKWVEPRIIITNKPIRATIEAEYKRVRVPKNDYIADVVTAIYEIVTKRFKLEGDWEELALGNDRRNWNRLISCIKKEIKYEVPKLYRNGYETTKNVKTEDGSTKRVHWYVNANFTSLDNVLINPKDGDKTAIVETVENSYWQGKDGGEYEMNLFYQWYKANYERILTKSQVEFIHELQKFNYGADDKKSAMIRQYSDIDTRTIALKLNRIKEKLLKHWKKESKFFKLTYNEQILNKRLNLLKLYFDIVDSDEDLDRQNKRLSNFIIANIDATVIEQIIDTMSEDDRKEIIYAYQNKTIIINEVLYRFTILADEKISELEVKLANEQAIKEQIIKKEKVVVPEELIIPNGVSCVYLTLNAETGAEENIEY